MVDVLVLGTSLRVRVRLPPKVLFAGMMELVVMLDLKSSGQ